MGRRPLAIIDLHLVLREGRNVLLSLRSGTGFADGNYGLVAGHLEADETLVQGMCREAREEIGIEIAEQELLLFHVMHNRSTNDRLAFFFECRKWAGEPINREPEKCAELRWVALDALASIENQVAYVRSALRHIDDGVMYSSFGGWHGCENY
ncbi:NUDIX hydrolase [Pseudomonas putida]